MRYLISLLFTMNAFALHNCVTVYEASGSAQGARPTLIHRWFARGEVAGYPRPLVGGASPSAWQADVKSRWDDGSVRVAYISWRQDLAANGSIQACFENSTDRSSAGDDAATSVAALTQAQMIGFDTGAGEGSWNGIAEGTVNSLSYSANAKTMLAAGNWSYWLKGPVVTWVVTEDRSTALSFDFGWEYDSGAAAWKAPTNDRYKSLHPIFCVQFWPDPDGAGSLTAWPGVEVDAILWNASTTRLQRLPLDLLRVLTGDGSTVSYSQSPANFYARRTWHAVVWSGTTPASVVTDYNLKYLVHSGAIPSYDYRITVAAGQADSDLSDYSNRVGAEKPEWCLSTSYCGNWMKYERNTGGRGDIGLIPRYYIRFLYGMGNAGYTTAKRLSLWNNLIIGNADGGSSRPVHFLETDTVYRTGSREFFTGSTPAFGRIVSIQSRPNLTLSDGYTFTTNGFETNNPTTPDGIFPACTSGPCDGDVNLMGQVDYSGSWSPDPNHWPSTMFVPWLLTGRPFYVWEQQFSGAFVLSSATSGRDGMITTPACTNGGLNNYGRWGDWGLLYQNANQRRNAWALREVYLAGVASPDGTAERDYFERALKNTDEAMEGYYNVTDGLYPPSDSACTGYVQSTTTDKWCAGNESLRFFGSNPLRLTYRGQEASGVDGPFNYAAGTCASLQVPHIGYLTTVYGAITQGAVFRHGGRPIFSSAMRELGKMQGDLVLSPDVNPFWASTLRPALINTGGTIRYPQTWADYASYIERQRTLYADVNATALTILAEGNTGSTYAPFDEAVTWAIKVDDEWMLGSTIGCNSCSNYDNRYNTPGAVYVTFNVQRRGIWGTTATDHAAGAPVVFQKLYGPSNTTGGYSFIELAGTALTADVAGSFGSGAKAHEWNRSNVTYQHWFATDTNSPMWAFMLKEKITNVRVTSGAGMLALRWVAPNGEACRVYVGGFKPTRTNDEEDAAATVRSREQTYLATQLSTGTAYYRISCGTARVSGEVEIE
jgi:hypothetical protein